jgi:hypothetical protein
MLFRSVENQIVSETLPRTVDSLEDWDHTTGDLPSEGTFRALYVDMFIAAEKKEHTRLGTRLNYEQTGVSSLFRRTGRDVDDFGELYEDQFNDLDAAWEDPMTWARILGDPDWIAEAEGAEAPGPDFVLRDGVETALPTTAEVYSAFAEFTQTEDEDNPLEETPWTLVYTALYWDLMRDGFAYSGPESALVTAAAEAAPGFETVSMQENFVESDKDWGSTAVWSTIQTYAPEYTPGYFLNSVDAQLTPDGIEARPENEQIYGIRLQAHDLHVDDDHHLLHPAGLSGGLDPRQPADADGEPADDPRPAAVLDLASGADLGLEGDAAAAGGDQRHPGLDRAGRRCQPIDHDQQPVRHHRRDDPHPAALHDPAALLGHGDDPAHLPPRGQVAGRERLDGLLAGLLPAIGAGDRRGVDPRLHPRHRLLHHAPRSSAAPPGRSSRTGSPITSRPR